MSLFIRYLICLILDMFLLMSRSIRKCLGLCKLLNSDLGLFGPGLGYMHCLSSNYFVMLGLLTTALTTLIER